LRNNTFLRIALAVAVALTGVAGPVSQNVAAAGFDGSEALTATYTIAQSSSASTTAPSVLAVVPGSTQLGATTSYRIDFSIQNALSRGDSVTVQFPAGMSVPTPVDGINFALVQSYQRVSSFRGNAVVEGNAITLTIPTPAGATVTLSLGLPFPFSFSLVPIPGFRTLLRPAITRLRCGLQSRLAMGRKW